MVFRTRSMKRKGSAATIRLGGVLVSQCDSNTRSIMCTRDFPFVLCWSSESTSRSYYVFHFQGEDSVEYFLGLTPSGIVVLRNKTTVAYYYWPRIAKVYFKGRYFMLRVCDKNVRISAGRE